jgi:hypothetical protein
MGCPADWPAPELNWTQGSSGLPKDLEEAQASLGFNIVISKKSKEISKDGINWIALSPESVDEIAYMFAYSNGFGRYAYTVQVANCAAPAKRYYQYQLRKVELDKTDIDIPLFFSIAENRGIFGGPSDFTKIALIKPALSECVSEMQSVAQTYTGSNFSSAIWKNGLYSEQPISKCKSLKELLPQTKVFYADTSCPRLNQRYLIDGAVVVDAGQTCEIIIGSYKYTTFSLAEATIIKLAGINLKGPDTPAQVASIQALQRKEAIGRLVSETEQLRVLIVALESKSSPDLVSKYLQPLRSEVLNLKMELTQLGEGTAPMDAKYETKITALKLKYQKVEELIRNQSDKAKKITITCIKGSSIKRITALKPKCPAGYKKK